jgi:hypothetical protein
VKNREEQARSNRTSRTTRATAIQRSKQICTIPRRDAYSVDLLRICLAPSATPAASPCQWPYVDAAAACGAMPFLSLVVKTQVGANSNFYFDNPVRQNSSLCYGGDSRRDCRVPTKHTPGSCLFCCKNVLLSPKADACEKRKDR